jgi:hypothetical protein
MLEDDRATAPSLYVKHDEVPPTEFLKTNSEDPGDLLPTVATVAVVGIGAAVVEVAWFNPGRCRRLCAAIFPSNWLGIAAAFQIHRTGRTPNWPEDPRSGCRGS